MWFHWHQNLLKGRFKLLHPVRHLKYFGTAPLGHRHRLAFGMWCWARNGSRFCIANCNSTIADGATPPVIQTSNGQNVYVFDCMSYVQKKYWWSNCGLVHICSYYIRVRVLLKCLIPISYVIHRQNHKEFER